MFESFIPKNAVPMADSKFTAVGTAKPKLKSLVKPAAKAVTKVAKIAPKAAPKAASRAAPEAASAATPPTGEPMSAAFLADMAAEVALAEPQGKVFPAALPARVAGIAKRVKPTASARTSNSPSAHIVAIRRDGEIDGHQLRINGGGPGFSKYFAAGRFGGADKALRAAQKVAREMGLPKAGARGGSAVGRLLSTNTSGSAGIRFEWVERSGTPTVRVVATWTDRKGVSRHTSYSADKHGLAGALDKAIIARTSCGAPLPDKVALLRLLKREFNSRK